MIRAKGGIKTGDTQKEAHMAYYIAYLNEMKKNYEEALKFYKNFFLSAQLLQDLYGTELALNRIAVVHGDLGDFRQSLDYNKKHILIASHVMNKFTGLYNCGICHRILGEYSQSVDSFIAALEIAKEENV